MVFARIEHFFCHGRLPRVTSSVPSSSPLMLALFLAAGILCFPVAIEAQQDPHVSISRELSGTPPVDGHWSNTAENRPASRPDYGAGQRSFHDEDVIYGFEVGKGLVDQVRGDYGSDDEFAEAVDQLAVRYSG
jgi:hypothetical protein